MTPQPQAIADYACETGEGPLWHPQEKKLYWADIPPGKIFRYDPKSDEHEQIIDAGEAIGGYTFQADGSLLLFMARGRIARWTEKGGFETIIDEIEREREGRFNDVIADPLGRVFCGTMPVGEQRGALYRLELDGTLHMALEDAGLSNGMGFTTNLKHFYHSDTQKRVINRYDYDLSTGAISNGVTVVEGGDTSNGHPDGMTMDGANCLWSARWDGHVLIHHMPDGQELHRVRFPAPKVSSVTFGGEDYTDMYVTTAGGHIREQDGEQAGVLFRINLGIRGKPAYLSRIQI